MNGATLASMSTKNRNKRVVIKGLTEQEALDLMVQLSQFHLPEGSMVSMENEPDATGGGDPVPPHQG